MSDAGRTQDRRRDQEPEPEEQAEASASEGSRELLDDVDELLDEIDDVLEENAEEFVRGYIQKGGQ